jgi:hypothetical protein
MASVPSPCSSSTYWQAARSFIAGSFSGAALVLAGHPFDTIVVTLFFEELLKCLLCLSATRVPVVESVKVIQS